ncbi:stress response protein NST1-like [Asparagus officinalis]|uniref:stress response protein NST1-like n=1 Tax=Asparagus officinalis TaxID=4686 RepID=UPI00098E4D5E|nr:stress response protein NST1-like [Asparagus officinalis]
MGAPLLSPSSSLLSKRQREAVAESSRAEAAKKARCDETVGTIQVTGGRDDVSPIRIPGVALSGSGVAPSGSGAVSPASPAASGAVQETPKDAPLPSDVRLPSGVPTASLPASRGAVEKVISIPSDEEEEAGDDEGLTGLADPAREIAVKEGPSSWANRSSRETGESEEDDDDASIHEALSSEEEDLAHEDATGQIGGSPAPAAVSAEDRSSVRESPLQREVSAQQVTTSLSGVTADAVIAVPRASLVTPVLATPTTTSTVMATGASTTVPSMMEEASLSPLERERRKSAARSVAEFHDTMAACIRLALEESCPFESFEEDIDYIIGFLIKRLKHSGAQPYFQRKEAVKEAIQQLLALRAKSSTLVDLASGEVRAVVQERDHRLNETMSLEARLSEELEQAKAENERMVLERQKADNRVSRLSSEVEALKQVIAKARASLAIQEKAREQAVKELDNIESHQQLTANSVEEKERAHKEAKETVQDLASRTDEDLRREILRRLELRHAEELREAELRLKSL